MVNQLNAEGVQALIYAHATPSLIDCGNLSKSSNFYNDLFDGYVSGSATGLVEETLWADGVFFNTVLDGMKPNRFTKIPLAPPSPTFASCQSEYDSLKAEEIFEKWLDVMEKDTRIGIKEINWRNLIACLESRNVRLNGLKWEDILSKSFKGSEKLNSQLKELESHIWSLDDLEHIASLMVGQKLSQPGNSRKNGEPLCVSVEHLECALEMASKMNYSMLVPSKDMISPNSHFIMDQPNSVSDRTKLNASVTFFCIKYRIMYMKFNQKIQELVKIQKALNCQKYTFHR
jgi:hypothetical protein